jgi:type I restriction enzyme M protein
MMKNFSLEENMSLDKIKTKLWSILEVFKKENISTDDFHVLLFFISAYKDEFLSAEIIDGKDRLFSSLNERLKISNTELANQYQSVLEIFKPSIQRLSDAGLKDVFKKITAINRQVLTDNFTFIFNSILFRISQSQGRFAGEFIQSVELTRLMCNLADLKKNASVFNPFSGIASFNIFINQDQNYFGQELNQKTWAIGKLRLLAYGRIENSRYDNDDSIYNWPNKSNKFDLIISFPPIGLDIRSKNIRGEFIHTYRRVEQLLIERSIENLTASGKVITIVPLSFLQRSNGEEHILSNLIDKDLIETIILLPGGLLANTGIPIAILILNKAKKLPGKVKFVDAKQFVISKGGREKVLDDYALDSYIRSHKEDDSIIRFVDNVQIRNNDYNLSVPRYFRKEIDGVRLGDILEHIKGKKVELPERGKLIRIRDLKDDKVDFSLSASNIEDCELKRIDIQAITESCLLLAMRWKTLKPTLFELNDVPVFKGYDIFSFKINESLVDKAYLIHELHADYVLEQIDAVRGGATIPFISKDDLLNVIIKLPSLHEQKAKVEGAIQALIQAKQDELKLQKEILGIKEDTFNEFASIKHTFRQYLGALKSNVSGTRKFLIKKNGMPISLDDIYSTKLNQTFSDHLMSIEDTITALSKLLETDKESLNSSKVECLNLIDLVKGTHKLFHQDTFEFELEIDKNSFGSNEKDINPLIDINKEDFSKLFSNIVSNAINHGFKNTKGNIIRSLISYDTAKESCLLEVSNNGIPIPEKFSFQHLTTRGEKTTDSKGTGIGGADIKDIVAKYNGEFGLIKDVDSPFPVTYKISFPISKTIIENEI